MKVQIYSFVFLALLAVAYAEVQCPAVDGDIVTQIADPTNCNNFYKCWEGVAYLEECPGGLEYNAELGVCDWAANAACTVSEK